MAQGEQGGKMRTSLTRLVAGTAIAATALLAAAGTASAGTTPAPARTPTSLSIVAAKSTITVGHLDAIGGVLASPKGPVVGRAIILDKATAKTDKWVPVEAKLTGKHGGVVFTVAPRIDTIYKLVFKGGPVYKASHSGVVLVVVKPFVKAPTTLSIVESSQSITAGQTDTISGALTLNSDHKALAHQWVWLGVVANGKAHLLRAFLTGKFGKVVFKVKPAASTTYQLVFRGTAVLAPTVSGTVLTTVAS
jgi:hypothetical protein